MGPTDPTEELSSKGSAEALAANEQKKRKKRGGSDYSPTQYETQPADTSAMQLTGDIPGQEMTGRRKRTTDKRS